MSEKIKCALVIGHSIKAQGAVNLRSGISEYQFNKLISPWIVGRINEENIDAVIIERESLKLLPEKINQFNPHFSIEMHCNSSENMLSSGSEVLYWHDSEKGKVFANILLESFIECGYRKRGIKPVYFADKGRVYLSKTTCPAIIAEPFFINNNDEFEYTYLVLEDLVSAYVKGINLIAEYIKNH